MIFLQQASAHNLQQKKKAGACSATTEHKGGCLQKWVACSELENTAEVRNSAGVFFPTSNTILEKQEQKVSYRCSLQLS